MYRVHFSERRHEQLLGARSIDDTAVHEKEGVIVGATRGFSFGRGGWMPEGP
jgi:hypothetical protein